MSPETKLDAEAEVLLRRILEAQAYRQVMAANIRGHALKFVPLLEAKVELVEDLNQSLAILRDVQRIYASLGGGDLALAVRGKMERIPYPGSLMDVAMFLALSDRATTAAARSYVDCVQRDFAAVSRSLVELERASTRRLTEELEEFCADRSNRPLAQQMFNRWLALCFVSMGRPGTVGDARAVALRLRSQTVEQVATSFLADLDSFRARCGLEMPAAATLGVELPRSASASTYRTR